MKTEGYFDYAATTPLDPAVRAAMEPYLGEVWGNPSSMHARGRTARQAVERARTQVADLVGGTSSDIVFTASGTEADNLAVIGGALSRRERGRHVLVSAVEHHAVLHSAEFLRSLGFEVEHVPVLEDGRLGDIPWRPDTVLLSCMTVNNETGVVWPVTDLGAECRNRGVLFHTDAVQAAGLLPIDAREVDMLSLSAHKLHGPKGVGALFVQRGIAPTPLMWGGTQENGRRAGTENVAGVVGMGLAAELARRHREDRVQTLLALSDHLQAGLGAAVPWARRIGCETVPSIHSYFFPGVDGEALVCRLDLEGQAVSLGAACSSGALSPSHVLRAMGFAAEDAWSVIRISIGHLTTTAQLDRLIEVLALVVPLCSRRRRRGSPADGMDRP